MVVLVDLVRVAGADLAPLVRLTDVQRCQVGARGAGIAGSRSRFALASRLHPLFYSISPPHATSRGGHCQAVNPVASITLDGILRGCLDCGLALVDAHDTVTLLNQPAGLLLELPAGSANELGILPPSVRELVVRVRQSGSPDRLREWPGWTSSDHGHALQVEALPLPSTTGSGSVLLVLLGARQDSPLEQRLKHFERLARLGIMSAGLAHEFRNALVPVGAMAELLLQREPDEAFAQTVRHELQRANNLAAQMLKYSRPRQAVHESLSLHGVLERSLALARSRIKESGAELELQLDAAPDTLVGDEAHLEQVFVNLLFNAADAIAGGGSIVVATERTLGSGTPAAMVVTVADNGIGIAPENQPNLFHPFFTTKRHGTGLGLFMAHRIVTEHRGQIALESAPGRGTSVRVTLPVDASRS